MGNSRQVGLSHWSPKGRLNKQLITQWDRSLKSQVASWCIIYLVVRSSKSSSPSKRYFGNNASPQCTIVTKQVSPGENYAGRWGHLGGGLSLDAIDSMMYQSFNFHFLDSFPKNCPQRMCFLQSYTAPHGLCSSLCWQEHWWFRGTGLSPNLVNSQS